MTIDSVASLVAQLRDSRLLEGKRLDELTRDLQHQFTEPRALAKELIQRGWLSPYQINLLFQGRGQELMLGPYVLLERLGEGGMGMVFKARHLRLGRTVALKVIRKEKLAKPEIVRRFQREITAAAQLAHPNVVLAYDADQAGGTNFFAMEYVEGIDLGRLVKRQGPLPVREACAYIQQAALGLQHAYERGLVHRDIKPSNLMLSARGALIKILDLGLARLLEPIDQEESDTRLTDVNSVMGTLDYLAPEQALNSHLADTRADLYSLGCTFYFLLTGRPPFPGGAAVEKLLKHRVAEPVPINKVRPDVPHWVVAVVARLMAKRPEDRYQTPAELAAALAAAPPTSAVGFAVPPPELATETGSSSTLPSPRVGPGSSTEVSSTPVAPPRVEPPRATENPWSSVITAAVADEAPTQPQKPPATPLGRQRLLMAAAATLAVAVVAVAVILLSQSRPGRQPQADPRTSAGGAPTIAANKPWQDTGVDIRAGSPVLIRARGDWKKGQAACSAAGLAGASTDRAVLPEAPWMCLVGRIGNSDPPMALGASRTIQPTRSGRLFVQANDLDLHENTGRLVLEIDGGTRPTAPAAAPGPTRIEAAEAALQTLLGKVGAPNEAESVRADLLALARTYPGSPQGRQAAAALTQLPSPLDLVERSQIAAEEQFAGLPAEVVAVLGHRRWRHWGSLWTLAFSPDGKTLASGGSDRVIRLWDVARERERAVLKGHTGAVLAVAFAPDGKTLASSSADKTIRFWDLAALRQTAVLKGMPAASAALAYAPDGKVLATGSADGIVKLWDTTTRSEKAAFRGQKGTIACLAYAPDGKTLAAGSTDGSLWLWIVATGQAAHTLPKAHAGSSTDCLAYAPDGKTLATGGSDGKVKLWHTDSGVQARILDARARNVRALVFTADGTALASGHADGTVRVWDTATGAERFVIPGHSQPVRALAYFRQGNVLASGSLGGSIRLWDAGNGAEKFLMHGHTGMVHGVSFSPDCRHLASWADDKTVQQWEIATGSTQPIAHAHTGGSGSALYAPDGKTLALVSGNTIRLVEPQSGKLRAALKGHLAAVRCLAYTLDGKQLVSGSDDQTVRVWDAATGEERVTFSGLHGAVRCVAFSPDGKMVASGTATGTLRLHDAATGELRITQALGTPPVMCVVYAPDGRTLALGHGSTLKLWDVATAKERAVLAGHRGTVLCIAYSPNGKALVSSGQDGRVIEWAADSGTKQREWLFPGAVHGVAFANDGRHLATGNSNGTVFILRLASVRQKAQKDDLLSQAALSQARAVRLKRKR